MTTYLKSQVSAVAEMDPLKHAHSPSAAVSPLLRFRKRLYAPICDVGALHQSYPLQLRQGGQLHDRVVGEVPATRQINIPDAVAQLDKLSNTRIRDARTMAQMNVV